MNVTPLEREIDGVQLGTLTAGSVRAFSSVLGLWLIAQGYAQPEMRRETREVTAGTDPQDSSNDYDRRASDRRKRRS